MTSATGRVPAEAFAADPDTEIEMEIDIAIEPEPDPFDPSLDLVEGDQVDLEIGAVAHGGHCVARLGGEHGRVVFVRHALPGEHVTARITELHKGYLRADAIEIHQASPDRVTPPCPHAHPGGCGGCDLQHASAEAQLRWKTDVVKEQLQRLAKTSFPVRVESLPAAQGAVTGRVVTEGTPDPSDNSADPARLLGWRTRVRYAVDAAGRPGLLQHRSHQVVPIDRCHIAHPAIQELDLLAQTWNDADALEAVASSGGDVTVLAHATGNGTLLPDDPSEAQTVGTDRRRLQGPEEVTELAAGRTWTIPPDSFWQIHPAAAGTLVTTVLEMLDPQEGETAWDLYGGAGLFAAAIAEKTNARTTVVESSPTGVATARTNLADLKTVEVVAARVETALTRRRITGPVDLIVLDPPRSGAGAKVVSQIVQATPRAVVYVACDPASLARDIATFQSLGWHLESLRAFDCFPMTSHIESVALLKPLP